MEGQVFEAQPKVESALGGPPERCTRPKLNGSSSRRNEPEGCGFEPRRTHPELTHCCVVRVDLPRGTFAAQLIHAAGESAGGSLSSGTIAVALGAKDEDELLAVERQLRARGIPHRAIREPDPPWNGALMAIGIEPVADRAAVRPVTGRLPLIR